MIIMQLQCRNSLTQTAVASHRGSVHTSHHITAPHRTASEAKSHRNKYKHIQRWPSKGWVGGCEGLRFETSMCMSQGEAIEETSKHFRSLQTVAASREDHRSSREFLHTIDSPVIAIAIIIIHGLSLHCIALHCTALHCSTLYFNFKATLCRALTAGRRNISSSLSSHAQYSEYCQRLKSSIWDTVCSYINIKFMLGPSWYSRQLVAGHDD
jgi:hypothetical protein